MTKLIPILSGRCLVVELPEGAKHKRIEVRHLGCFLVTTSTRGELMAKLPPGNWRIIGMLSEVTDAELADVTGFYYNKYNERYVEIPTSAMRATPIGDVEDAILAEGYYLDENTIAAPDFSGGNIRFSETVEYAKSQSRVLDRSRCLLLGRELEVK